MRSRAGVRPRECYLGLRPKAFEYGVSVWFEGLTVTPQEDGDTLLIGTVVDQAALHGLLRKVRDPGIPPVSVIRVTPDPAGAPEVGE